MIDNDDIIVDGLLKIKNGVETNSMQLICDGYNLITNENLKPVVAETKSRLDNIREKIANKKNKSSSKKQRNKVDEDDIETVEKENGNMLVISTDVDEEMLSKNEAGFKAKKAPIRQSITEQYDIIKNPAGGIRYRDLNDKDIKAISDGRSK